eukprot:TRINITY_DN1585_c0_g1_i1.p1 TRINITY_DN1585_c0_g1~~TRINITY_DN1585_c0_g1_i1.p1  ORF type:complete len:757 (-),score=150.79 TRINITY_DN1585_c0_g1_i1:99-2369(-)
MEFYLVDMNWKMDYLLKCLLDEYEIQFFVEQEEVKKIYYKFEQNNIESVKDLVLFSKKDIYRLGLPLLLESYLASYVDYLIERCMRGEFQKDFVNPNNYIFIGSKTAQKAGHYATTTETSSSGSEPNSPKVPPLRHPRKSLKSPRTRSPRAGNSSAEMSPKMRHSNDTSSPLHSPLTRVKNYTIKTSDVIKPIPEKRTSLKKKKQFEKIQKEPYDQKLSDIAKKSLSNPTLNYVNEEPGRITPDVQRTPDQLTRKNSEVSTSKEVSKDRKRTPEVPRLTHMARKYSKSCVMNKDFHRPENPLKGSRENSLNRGIVKKNARAGTSLLHSRAKRVFLLKELNTQGIIHSNIEYQRDTDFSIDPAIDLFDSYAYTLEEIPNLYKINFYGKYHFTWLLLSNSSCTTADCSFSIISISETPVNGSFYVLIDSRKGWKEMSIQEESVFKVTKLDRSSLVEKSERLLTASSGEKSVEKSVKLDLSNEKCDKIDKVEKKRSIGQISESLNDSNERKYVLSKIEKSLKTIVFNLGKSPVLFSLNKLDIPFEELQKEILSVESENHQKLKKFDISILYCKNSQKDPLQMLTNQPEGPTYQKFLDLLGVTNNDSIIHWNGFKIVLHLATRQNEEEHRRLIGNTQAVIFFHEPGESLFRISQISNLGVIPQLFFVVTPEVESGKYRLGFFSRKSILPYEPHIPANYLFDDSNLVDFMFTKIQNGYLRSMKYSPMSRLFEEPRRVSLMKFAEKFYPKAFHKIQKPPDKS